MAARSDRVLPHQHACSGTSVDLARRRTRAGPRPGGRSETSPRETREDDARLPADCAHNRAAALHPAPRQPISRLFSPATRRGRPSQLLDRATLSPFRPPTRPLRPPTRPNVSIPCRFSLPARSHQPCLLRPLLPVNRAHPAAPSQSPPAQRRFDACRARPPLQRHTAPARRAAPGRHRATRPDSSGRLLGHGLGETDQRRTRPPSRGTRPSEKRLQPRSRTPAAQGAANFGDLAQGASLPDHPDRAADGRSRAQSLRIPSDPHAFSAYERQQLETKKMRAQLRSQILEQILKTPLE